MSKVASSSPSNASNSVPADAAFRNEAQQVAQMPFPQPIIGLPRQMPAVKNPLQCGATILYGIGVAASAKKAQQARQSGREAAEWGDLARNPNIPESYTNSARFEERVFTGRSQQQARDSIGLGAGAGAVGILGNPDLRHCLPAPRGQSAYDRAVPPPNPFGPRGR